MVVEVQQVDENRVFWLGIGFHYKEVAEKEKKKKEKKEAGGSVKKTNQLPFWVTL